MHRRPILEMPTRYRQRFPEEEAVVHRIRERVDDDRDMGKGNKWGMGNGGMRHWPLPVGNDKFSGSKHGRRSRPGQRVSR